MKKRFFALLLSLLCLSCLSACKKEEPVAEKAPSSSPLFNLKSAAGKGQYAAFFPLSKGFVYFSETDTGFHAGFVDPENSVSCDNILAAEGKIDFSAVRVFETEGNRAIIYAGDRIYLAVLDQNASQAYPVPEGVDLSGALLYDSCAFIYPDAGSGLLILAPYDFSERYVLCDTAHLQDFGGLISYEPESDRICYALKNDSGYYGVASFEYSKDVTLDATLFPFDSFSEVAPGKALFCRNEAEGQSFSYLDFSSGRKTDFSVKKRYFGFCASANGEYFIGIDKPFEESGGFIDIVRISSGTRLARYSCGIYACNPDLALSPSGSVILFSLFSPGVGAGDEIVAYIDLQQYLAE